MAVVPEIEFSLNSQGITIFSKYLNTPRFVPFDHKGRCPTCKSDNVELDYTVFDKGVIIYCTRIKGDVTIVFDKHPFAPKEGAVVRMKSRSRAFNIPMGINKIYSMKMVENPPPPPPSNEPALDEIPMPPTELMEKENIPFKEIKEEIDSGMGEVPEQTANVIE